MSALMTLVHAEPLREKTQVEPMVFRKTAVSHALSINIRTLERLLSTRRFPQADAWIGKCPVWRKSTVETWLANGGSKTP
jgi:predicted DNA-binding transcriptional regulator AlpA